MSGSGRPSTAISAAGDGTGVPGLVRRGRRGAARRARGALDLGRSRRADAPRRARSPRSERLRRKEAFRRALQRLLPVGPGIYELAARGHDRLPLRGGDGRGRSTTSIAMTADVNIVKGADPGLDGPVPGSQLSAAASRRRSRAAHGERHRRRHVGDAARAVAAGGDRRPSQTHRSATKGSSLVPAEDLERVPRRRARGRLAAAERAPRARCPTSTDVLVVGGGLAGTSLAYYLARHGRRGRARRAGRAQPRGFRAPTPAASTSRSRSTSSPATETDQRARSAADGGAPPRRGGGGVADARSRSSTARSTSTSPAG